MKTVIPWNLDVLFRAPAVYPAPGFKELGVRALFYRGLDWRRKPTKIFAWYGAPKKQDPTGRFPAMILAHGGGGTAFAEWVRLWNRRGYAALAMDLCGCVPKRAGKRWKRQRAGGPPGWDASFSQIAWPLADQWPFHAVADVSLAHSLAASFPEVDPVRIGLTGISWGGYVTCLAAGVDPRFGFAAPVYGCGFLGTNSVWLDSFARMGKRKAARWLKLWDPASRLPRSAMPMLWVTGTNDFAYPLDSLRKSYRLPSGPRMLAIRVRMPHGHEPGWAPKEIHALADNLFKNGAPLPRLEKQGMTGRTAWVVYAPESRVGRGEFNFTAAKGPWQQREWKTCPARHDTRRRRLSAEIPSGATVFYFNACARRGLIASSEHVEI